MPSLRAAHPLVRTLRLALAALIAAAVVTQLTHVHSGMQAANFFSFFTIQTNLLVVVLLVWGALRGPTAAPSGRYDGFRGAVTLYIALVGVVFALLLARVSADLGLTLPWVNRVVHYISPVLVVVDFLLVAPAVRLRWSWLGWWLVFPLAYLAYSLVRGALVDWYPYPFLDHRLIGWGSVTRHALGITIGVLAAAPAIVAIGNHLARDEPTRTDS